MKAIACPQCGALIKTVSLKDNFAHCDYCEAKILLPNDKKLLIEIPDEESAKKDDKPQLTPYEQQQENYRKAKERASMYDAPYTYPQAEKNFASFVPFLIVFGGIILFTFIGANSKSCLSRPLAEKDEKKAFKPINSPKIDYTVPTPLPQINYQVKVQWQGKNDMERFENPQIDYSKLPSLDENELKKTVFKNRAVQVRITIDTDGAVSKAEAVSGHPVLKEAAVNAARKTVFNPRQKPTNRTLTYYFHLTGDN